MTVTNVHGGFNLEVNQGSLLAAGPGVQVSGNGFQATHTVPTFTSWDVNWTAPSEGSGSVRLKLAVLAGNGGSTSGDAQGTTIVNIPEGNLANAPPSITNLSILPSYPMTSNDLVADYTFTDSDQDAESGTTYAWHLNGTLMSEHVTSTLPSTATTKGDTWRVDVTPSDGESTGEAVMSANVTIVNSPPRFQNLTASNLNPSTSNSVSIEFKPVDDDGDEFSTAFRWLLDGVHVSSLDGNDVLPAVATRDGDTWVGQVQGTDNESVSGWYSTPTITVGGQNTPPSVTSVTFLNGTSTPSDINLIVNFTATDLEGDSIQSVEHRWLRNAVWVSSAGEGNTLLASQTNRGDRWSVEVRVSDGSNWSAWFTSQEVLVTNAAPTATAEINHLDFTVADGFSLSTTTFDNDGDNVTVGDVIWYLDNQSQTDYRGQHSLPSSALAKGEEWSAEVLFSDGELNITVNTQSVLLTNSAPLVTITTPANITALEPLIVSVNFTDADNDNLTLTTAWYRNGFLDSTLQNATTVPLERLAPGQTWRMEATVDDGETTGQMAELVRTVTNLPPLAVITLLTDEVWMGEEVRVTSSASTDPEQSNLFSTWTLNGVTITGPEAKPIVERSGTLNLTVTDEHGASTTTSITLTPSSGPQITGLSSTFDSASAKVVLEWSWSGPNVGFQILRNGMNIGETTNTSFSDFPPTEGLHVYTVQPFSEDRTYHAGTAEGSVQTTADAAEAESSSEGGGLAIALLLLVLGTLSLVSSRRRW